MNVNRKAKGKELLNKIWTRLRCARQIRIKTKLINIMGIHLTNWFNKTSKQTIIIIVVILHIIINIIHHPHQYIIGVVDDIIKT